MHLKLLKSLLYAPKVVRTEVSYCLRGGDRHSEVILGRNLGTLDPLTKQPAVSGLAVRTMGQQERESAREKRCRAPVIWEIP